MKNTVIDPTSLENARLARVLPCAICTMAVAHDHIAVGARFRSCTHVMFVCVRCAHTVAEAVIQAAAEAHSASCKRVLLATKLPEPGVAS